MEPPNENPWDAASVLQWLFKNISPEGRGPYSTAEVATGAGVSESTIKDIRAGRKSNPTMNTLTAIAAHFGITPEVWVNARGPEYVLARQQLQDVMLDAGVIQVAMRAGGLDAENLAFLALVIDKARKDSGLGPANGGLDLSM
jgi:transcriptional regulator with XRE-family HTH domain